MDDIILKVENLSKMYKLYNNPIDRLKESINPFRKKYHKDFYALKNVSFEVKKGETVGIIGKNGSGKSTILKIITGILTPSEGNIFVDGKISALLELGAGFNPEFTGIENIYLNGTIMGYTKEEIDAKLEEILHFADIGDFVNQPVKTYSSGMYVRLAFAVAINVDPDILIVDEALSVGDAKFQQKCYSKFESFKNSGKTILFVSHSLENIKMYCNRAILLDHGEVKKEGSPKDVVNLYLKMLRDFNLGSAMIKTDNSSIIESLEKDNKSMTLIEESMWYNKNEYKYGTNEVVFSGVGLFNESGDLTNEFETGGYMTVLIELTANSDLDILYLGYGIRNLQGQDLLVFNGTPSYDNFAIKDAKKGKVYRLKIQHKVFLVPNDYTITLSITKIDGERIIPLQIRYDSLLFKVLGVGRNYAGVFFDDLNILLTE